MHKPKSVLENEVRNILCNFKIQTDHSIPARMSDVVLINMKKRTCHLGDLGVLVDHRQIIKENEMIDSYQELARDLM